MTVETKPRRTYDEVTGDLLVKRLSNEQLVELVGNRNYREFQPKILEHLQLKDGLRVGGFRTVHISKDCEIEELPTGEKVRIAAFDWDLGKWSGTTPLRQLTCTHHEITSVTYIDNHGNIIEGSFIGYLE